MNEILTLLVRIHPTVLYMLTISIYISAAVPTVGDAMQALEFITEDIANTLRQISDLGAEIANKNHIMVEHTKDILRHLHATLLQELDVDQKRSLICQQMEHVRQEAKVTVRTLFGEPILH